MPVRTNNRTGETAFPFLRRNKRAHKPRKCGVTEIRGPYYTPLGKRLLEDILETMGNYVDALKFAGGSFSLMPRHALTDIISLCHDHDVLVSTGGFIEHVLTQGPEAVNRYIQECKQIGFDIVEISSGFVTLPADDWLRLVEKVQKTGLKAKPEVGIQFGAGGATKAEELEAEGTRDPEWPILLAKRFLAAGAYMIMIESEGITENVNVMENRCTCEDCQRSRLGKGDVRGSRPRSLRLVHQELRSGSQPIRGSQPDRAA